MLERHIPEIKIMEEASSKRDYCEVPLDEEVRDNLICLITLEGQLSENLTAGRKEGITLAHTLIWNRLQDYYKSELADLTGVYLGGII